MKKKEDTESDGMLPEYDFTTGRVEQGKFHEFAQRAKATRVLEPDLVKEFKDSESVNEALREYLKLKRQSA
jgi:hypothetical protein